MWLQICNAGPMMAYRCDVTSVLAAQMASQPTNFCLLLPSVVPYFTYFAVLQAWNNIETAFTRFFQNSLFTNLLEDTKNLHQSVSIKSGFTFCSPYSQYPINNLFTKREHISE